MKIRLKQLREERNLTPAETAQALDISARDLEAYEAEKAELPVDLLPALSDYFDVSVDYLVGISGRRGTGISKAQASSSENERKLRGLLRRIDEEKK